MDNFIIYEQPISENVRNFLKCEYLNEKFNYFLKQDDIWSIKSSINTLLEMSDFIFRINIKMELLKEFERNIFFLNYLNDHEEIELNKYDELYSKIKIHMEALNNIDSNPSKSINENDFLMQIKSKCHIPAGNNFFDMPAYLNFLSSNKTSIIDNINNWYSPFSTILSSSILVLDTKRTISKFENISQADPYFERKIDKSLKIDLVRIKLGNNINIYPDISASAQNINILFKTSYGKNRLSKVADESINFGLSISSSSSSSSSSSK